MIAGAILLALFCWAFTFGWTGGNFWVKIGVSVVIVFSYSCLWQKPAISFKVSSLALGLLSAALLYLIFYAGHALAPMFLQGAHPQVAGIYSLGEGTSKVPIFLLLFFVTGPGEEFFWRGFLQAKLVDRLGNVAGFLAATAVYAGVHVFSLNPMLILAALVAGAFWGALYLWRKDLLLQIISHSAWSAVIFTVAPIR